jgi:hypothetical protein
MVPGTKTGPCSGAWHYFSQECLVPEQNLSYSEAQGIGTEIPQTLGPDLIIP